MPFISEESSGSGPEVASGALASLSVPVAGVNDSAIPMDTDEKDTDGYWAVGQPSRFDIPAGLGGLFVVTVYVQFAADVTITGGEAYLIPSGACPNAYSTLYKDLLGANVWRGTCTAILYATAGQNIS